MSFSYSYSFAPSRLCVEATYEMDHVISEFADRIRKAGAERTPLRIQGSGSKDFYGAALKGAVLSTTGYTGIVDYEPTELVLTARAGTPLRELESALAERGQMFAFEPPHFGAGATLGGCIASGFSGPRRVAAGSARDFVLGVRMLNAQGDDLQFGGRVMKNVAGFDVSRLMAGSCGTLGLMLDVSLKVLPRPASEATLRYQLSETAAIRCMNEWAGLPIPITATCWFDGTLTIRLSGATSAVTAARAKLGGDDVADSDTFWIAVREHTLPAFQGTLWRLSVKSSAPPLGLSRRQIVEWNGGLRWLAEDIDEQEVREAAKRAGGHATLFRGGDHSNGIFQLDSGVLALHRRVKAALDPQGIFGPGRLHPDF